MRVSGTELKTEGVVRVMHPERGMGVEFTQATPEHRALLEKFLALLTENSSVRPELLVEPEGLETDIQHGSRSTATLAETDDALLALFRSHAALSSDLFMEALRQQRGLAATAVAGTSG
jgi:hypothetical protein